MANRIEPIAFLGEERLKVVDSTEFLDIVNDLEVSCGQDIQEVDCKSIHLE